MGMDWLTQVQDGLVQGWRILEALGERPSVTTVQGEDIWPGLSTTIPKPPPAGVFMSLVSSSTTDTAGGVGAQQVEVHYIDANGDEQSVTKALNGTTAVDIVVERIRFPQRMEVAAAGANGVATGVITLHLTGAPATVYTQIDATGNKSLSSARMVPRGKKLLLRQWHVTEARGKRSTVRLRSSDHSGIASEIFHFRDVTSVSGSTSPEMTASHVAPELSVVKLSAWPQAIGGEITSHWWGYLVDL